jgi:hypothetical protein
MSIGLATRSGQYLSQDSAIAESYAQMRCALETVDSRSAFVIALGYDLRDAREKGSFISCALPSLDPASVLSNFAQQKQDNHNDQNQAQSAARHITPALAVWPRRDCPDQ